MPLYYVTKLTF